MNSFELDDVDRGILHLLQEDARNNSASNIAEEVGVAPNTVRNRLEQLESAGVIQGYTPHIDYERAGYHLHVKFICSVPVSDRNAFADDVLGIEGVVRVVEILSGRDNLVIEAIGENSDDLTAIASQLESIGVEINGEQFVKSSHVQPFDHFGVSVAD